MDHGGLDICKSAPARHWSGWRQPGVRQDKRGANTKVHLAVDAHGNPLRVFVAKGTVADCRMLEPLVGDLACSAEKIIADRAYDSDAIVGFIESTGANPVIPPKRNRRKPRVFDSEIYKSRHLVENAFQKLRRWRGIATRYAKNKSSYLVAVQIGYIMLWVKTCDGTFSFS